MKTKLTALSWRDSDIVWPCVRKCTAVIKQMHHKSCVLYFIWFSCVMQHSLEMISWGNLHSSCKVLFHPVFLMMWWQKTSPTQAPPFFSLQTLEKLTFSKIACTWTSAALPKHYKPSTSCMHYSVFLITCAIACTEGRMPFFCICFLTKWAEVEVSKHHKQQLYCTRVFGFRYTIIGLLRRGFPGFVFEELACLSVKKNYSHLNLTISNYEMFTIRSL